ncbi:MAG: hypothetical protein M1830_007652, partial [Pleopsidium flavum]
MTLPSPQTQAESVKHAVASLTICSSSTVATLNQLLSPKSGVPTNDLKQPPRVAVKATTAARTKARPGTTSKTRVKAKVTVLEVPESQEKRLEPCEKLVLATEICNVSLKVLTEASKSPSQLRRQSSTKDVNHLPKSASGNQLRARSTSALQQALQPRSLNSVSSSPGKLPLLRRSSSCASIGPALGLVAVAECARLGFAALRSLHAQGIQRTEMPPLQLENGMSVLVGKLIALGLDDLAVKELRILKRRLDTSHTALNEDKSKGQEMGLEKETLANLLLFGHAEAEGPELAMMIGAQMHALKLVASRRQPSIIEDVVDNLQLSKSGSPADLISKSSGQGPPSSVSKAARQLETLAHILLSLCPSIFSSDDANVAHAKAMASPQTTFRAQVLALEIKIRLWDLTGHKGNIHHELYEPFGQCLAAFSRRSTNYAKVKYELAVEAFERLSVGIESTLQRGSCLSSESSLPSVYASLGNLAHECLLIEEAIRWNVDSLHLLRDKSTSCALQGACACKIASLRLRFVIERGYTDGLRESLADATRSLEGSLRGGSAEVDELMAAVAALRKAAMTWMIRSSPPVSEPCNMDRTLLDVRVVCTQLVHACIKFFARYIGTAPSLDQNARILMRYEQRRKLSSIAARSAIESVITITKISIGTDHISWEKLDSALQDCTELLMVLDARSAILDETLKGSNTDKQLIIVNLSNVYWLYYLKKKQALSAPRELVKSLQRSVDLIRKRTKLEKSAGFLAVKLERLGALYEGLGRFSDALNLFAEAARSHIDAGVLRNASSAAHTRSLTDVWEGEGAIGVFGKAISSWTRLAIKDDMLSTFPFDDKTLSLEERGFLLEWQLAVVSNLLDTKTTTDEHRRRIRILANLLLEIYQAEHFPIRRLRLILCLLRTESNHGDILDLDFIDKLAEEYENQSWQVSTTSDGGLVRYEEHLKACLTAALAFRKDCPSANGLQSALVIWSGILGACETWHCLGERVENRADWILQLQSITDYLYMQGLEMLRISALHLMVRIRELQEPVDYSALVRSMSELGLQYSRLGYSGKAGHALARAVKFVESYNVSTEIKLQWYLAYAEYLVEIGNFDKCECYLTRARHAAEDDPEMMKNAGSSATLRGRIRLNRLIADAAYVYSLLAFSEGHPETALASAKRCVRLYYRAWSGLELQTSNRTKSTQMDSNGNDLSGLSESFSILAVSACSVPPIMSSTHESLKSPSFWSLVPSVYRGLTLLSKLFAHQGMFLETIHYTEQTQRVVDAVRAGPWMAHNLAVSGDYWTRGENLQKGHDILDQAQDLTLQMPSTRDTATFYCHLANLHRMRCRWDDEAEAYESADKVLRGLTATGFVEQLQYTLPAVQGLEARMAKLALQDEQSCPEPAVKRQVRQRTKDPKKGRDQDPEVLLLKSQSSASECSTLLRVKGDILRQHACAMILRQKLEDATSILMVADGFPKSQQGLIQQRLGTAKQLLLHGLKSMSADAVFCILPESSISFPAVAIGSKSKERQIGERSPTRVYRLSPPRRPNTKSGGRKSGRPKTPVTEDFVDFLYQARETLAEVQIMAVQMCSSNTLHVISNVVSSILMLLSASCSAKAKNSINPYSAVHSRGLNSLSLASVAEADDSTEIGRIVSLQRERSGIYFDKQPMPQEELLRWPSTADQLCSEPVDMRMPVNHSSFQTDYIDIIPNTWKVISISLSESRDEIHISKLQGGSNPFMLRLPLGRHNSRDADEEIFSFDQGKAELLEITELANFSAQDARNMTSKGAKAEWWAEREALDGRLKDLLANVENIWLGGFRGVFSQQSRCSELLFRFQDSFQNILDKYLPSRQVLGKRNNASRVNLDSRILELFVGLGNSADVSELEEPLTDLLYFIVDVLQFHGERNAYDEVDFDSIIIETTDAIRYYHEAAQAEKVDQSASHTILILDKALHVFPWESLPCLDGQSVSRLPSLGCLRQRLLRQKQSGNVDSSEKSYINPDNGAYVLNPSGDLKATQAAFERPLQHLTNWDCIVQREPSEAEIKTALESRDLFLYFGHGSGAQYIRAKTIKRLDRCAVSLLMGCSSGALTEAGEFEPYGTPINYMHAGCSALVATLWDVTDKDIDRFSYAVLY